MLREASEQVPQHLFLLGQRPFAARTAAQGDMEQVILDDVRSFGRRSDLLTSQSRTDRINRETRKMDANEREWTLTYAEWLKFIREN